jgi:hypothetical protein
MCVHGIGIAWKWSYAIACINSSVQVKRCMSCGMTDVLTKPFDRLTLSLKVAKDVTGLQEDYTWKEK